jgi:hypothetical protein
VLSFYPLIIYHENHINLVGVLDGVLIHGGLPWVSKLGLMFGNFWGLHGMLAVWVLIYVWFCLGSVCSSRSLLLELLVWVCYFGFIIYRLLLNHGS